MPSSTTGSLSWSHRHSTTKVENQTASRDLNDVILIGRLSFEDEKSWSIRVALLLRVNVEARVIAQRDAIRAMENREPHEPFRWFMYLSDFARTFE